MGCTVTQGFDFTRETRPEVRESEIVNSVECVRKRNASSELGRPFSP